MSASTLDRRQGESTRDYFLRLLRDPMCEGASLADVADLAGIAPAKARTIRGDERVLTYAAQIAEDIGWTEQDGEIADLAIAALTAYAMRHCAAGRCTHELCARERRLKARDEARGRLSRPAHETRFQPAQRRGDSSLPARDPGEQTRGALPGRTGGGA